jgi:diguanylate cyclase (GGDEF)-like protein/PAS domain S-box-containing protein
MSASPRPFRSLDDPETLRRLAERSGQGLYITQHDGTIVDGNPAFRALLGTDTLEELRTHNARELFADATQRDVQLALLARNGEVRDFEFQLLRPDGELRTVCDTAYVCRDPETGEEFIHGILVDITKQRALEIQLLDQNTRDPLTGCYNRRFLDELEARLAASEVRSWGCIYMDIDRFKDYNDRFGHQEGDAILIRMSRFLLRQVRADEHVVRLGGDEFLVVLSNTDDAGTEKVARRLQLAAATGAPVPFSLGWAAREGDEHLEKTIDRADRGLLAVRVVARTDRRD